MTDTRREAIERLIEKVEADGLISNWGEYGLDHETAVAARKAHEGSLDAAKALHEEVLPGWGWVLNSAAGAKSELIAQDAIVDAIEPFRCHAGNAESAARSWLLAILRALASEEGGAA